MKTIKKIFVFLLLQFVAVNLGKLVGIVIVKALVFTGLIGHLSKFVDFVTIF